jgi:hypothetical protein
MLSTAYEKFPSFFLFIITHYVDEIIVIFSVWICTYRSTTDNIFYIRYIVEKKLNDLGKCWLEEILRFEVFFLINLVLLWNCYGW